MKTKISTDRGTVSATNRAALLRHLAFVNITNLADLRSAFSPGIQVAVESHIKRRLLLAEQGRPSIVFQDGPFILIDLAGRVDAAIDTEDALCEYINALLMEEPVVYEKKKVLLKVETTLIEWTDEERQLVRKGEISRLMARMLEALKLKDSEKKYRSLRADMELTATLYSELAENRLVLAFQPVFSARDRNVVLYWESLLRRRPNDDAQDFSSCAHYIAAAERVRLESRLDRGILWTHINLLKKYPDIKLGCNISAQSLSFNCWWRVLFRELSNHPEVAGRLVIEVTETGSIATDDEAILLLRTLQVLGCRVAIDGMGAVYGTVSFVLHTQPDFIKIDKTDFSPAGRRTELGVDQIVSNLIKLCTDLGSSVIAQGLESETDLAAPSLQDAQGLQGHFLCPPSVLPPWLAAPAIVEDAFASTHESYRSAPLIPAMNVAGRSDFDTGDAIER